MTITKAMEEVSRTIEEDVETEMITMTMRDLQGDKVEESNKKWDNKECKGMMIDLCKEAEVNGDIKSSMNLETMPIEPAVQEDLIIKIRVSEFSSKLQCKPDQEK